ncbi:MAG: pseudaminic acid cytidylyltransferase [Lachnospiraceae bacterium]|nr:pseudaminic acid cytidylyltransferase [Lachnospiraceae bacterium]
MLEKRIAIITARGGSKRIPKKNIKEFCGKPIIAYSIEAALDSGIFDEVMVSTDSEEIAKIARNYGASVPFMRSEETSNDFATTRDVIMEVIDKYKSLGRTFEYIFCIYPTAPFITSEKLIKVSKIMEEKQPIEIIPVVQFSFPPQRCFVIDENNFMSYKYKEFAKSRSQDLEKCYHDAGQFYVYNTKKYLELDGNIVDGIMPIIVPEMEVQDIDNEEDWKIAELKYRIMQEN